MSRHAALAHAAILASAGSGKTHQLVLRYLRLLVLGADPSSILTSTFTRLAAGEIRDRILRALVIAATSNDGRDDRAAAFGLPRGVEGSLAAIDLLQALARRMHVLQVRTLDSFFASIVRAFAEELGLPPEPQIVDEPVSAALRREAIARMLDERDPQPLVDLLRQLTRGTSERAITDTIEKTVAGMAALWRQAPAEAWACVPEQPGLLPPPALQGAIERLESITPQGGRGASAAHRRSCEAARLHRWQDFIERGLAKAIAQGGRTYQRKDIGDDALGAYQPLVSHARAVIIERVRIQTLATRDLLDRYHAQLERLKERDRIVTFDDLAFAAARAAHLGTLDDITYRIDARIRHLLLDEFQDTSLDQWHALEPLVREIISTAPPDRSFFCVGDIKQSIYAWRDAAPEVLEALPHLLTGPEGASAIETPTLSTSWRSSPIIVDTVNRVFAEIDANPALVDASAVARAWQRGFQRHDTRKTDLPGYAELRYSRGGATTDARLSTRLAAAADLAQRLREANPSIEIALLTRTNASVARLLVALGPGGRGLRASGRGGGPLTDAPVVGALLDLLHLVDHPDDTIAAFHIASSPLAALVNLRDWRDARQRRSVARLLRRRLLEDGYAPTLADLAPRLAPACDDREMRRLLQLIEMAGAFDPRRTLRTNDFITLVETQAVADPQPAPVQVMTIHQAKGLEFDAVILPDLEGGLTGKPPPVVFDRDGETGPITRICRFMNRDVRSLVPGLDPLFDRHARRAVRESLSLLYVALTRAIHAVYMIVDPPQRNKDGSVSKASLKSLAGVVRSALAPGAVRPDEVADQRGDAAWFQGVRGRAAVTTPEPADRPVRLAPPRGPAHRGRRAASASATAARAGSSASRLRPSLVEARDRGLVAHALLRSVEWIERFDSRADRLTAVARIAAPRRDEAWLSRQVAQFLVMLQQPAIRAVLSRDDAWAAGATLSLHRELRFAHLVDGSVQSGVIDRLMVRFNGPSPVGARILDFKTDDIEPAECAMTAERHRPQLSLYRAAVAAAVGLPEAAIEMVVVFLRCGSVLELE